MYRRRRGRGDDQEHPLQVGRLEGSLAPVEVCGLSPGLHLRGGFGGDHADRCVGLEQARDLRFGNVARADYQARAVFEFQKKGEDFCGRLAFHFVCDSRAILRELAGNSWDF